MRESTKLCVNLAVNLKIKNPAHNAQPVQNNLEDHLLLNSFVKEQPVKEYLTDSSGILGQINLETLNNVHAIVPNILKAKKT